MANIYVKVAEKIINPPFLLMKPEISEKEFFEFATEDISCELIDGILMIHSPASIQHERIFQFLLLLLNRFLKKTKGGEVLGSQVVMRLASDLIPEPDLIVLLPENLTRIKDTFIDGPADLMIEILSPSTKKTDLAIKIPRCLEKGVKEIWAIDPMIEELIIYVPGEDPSVYKKEGIVRSNILQDFWIKLEWLWTTETIDPLDCLDEIMNREV
jgi:Uma2 family endonuclease